MSEMLGCFGKGTVSVDELIDSEIFNFSAEPERTCGCRCCCCFCCFSVVFGIGTELERGWVVVVIVGVVVDDGVCFVIFGLSFDDDVVVVGVVGAGIGVGVVECLAVGDGEASRFSFFLASAKN
jgi:hypothetical protein